MSSSYNEKTEGIKNKNEKELFKIYQKVSDKIINIFQEEFNELLIDEAFCVGMESLIFICINHINSCMKVIELNKKYDCVDSLSNRIKQSLKEIHLKHMN
jgi:hypothetical protein